MQNVKVKKLSSLTDEQLITYNSAVNIRRCSRLSIRFGKIAFTTDGDVDG